MDRGPLILLVREFDLDQYAKVVAEEVVWVGGCRLVANQTKTMRPVHPMFKPGCQTAWHRHHDTFDTPAQGSGQGCPAAPQDCKPCRLGDDMHQHTVQTIPKLWEWTAPRGCVTQEVYPMGDCCVLCMYTRSKRQLNLNASAPVATPNKRQTTKAPRTHVSPKHREARVTTRRMYMRTHPFRYTHTHTRTRTHACTYAHTVRVRAGATTAYVTQAL